MIIFDVNGAIIKFDDKRDNYNRIRKVFLNYAKRLSKEFEIYCEDNLKAVKQLNEGYLVFANKLLNEAIKKGVEILISYNVITVDFCMFKKNYCLKYFDFETVFNNILREKNSLNKKNKSNSKLFNLKPVLNKLSRSIYIDCFNIHMAVVDALLEHDVKDVESYINLENIKKANALFNNYKDGFISKPDSSSIVQKIIMANPYKKEVYEFLVREDGDFSCEIEHLADYIGYDLKTYKTYLMDEYVAKISKANFRDLDMAKEKIEKYARYIGLKEHSIYLTRIDAIYTFENA